MGVSVVAVAAAMESAGASLSVAREEQGRGVDDDKKPEQREEDDAEEVRGRPCVCSIDPGPDMLAA